MSSRVFEVFCVQHCKPIKLDMDNTDVNTLKMKYT